MAWATRGRSSTVFCDSRWRGDRTRATVALTFDDGPSESTPELLRVLEKYRVRATFFQCGAHVRRLRTIAAEAALTHEIGNHTETHPRLWLRSPEFLRQEVGRAQESIYQFAGVTPRWFRPPYGVRWPGLGAVLAGSGLTNVMWTILGRDWNLSGPEVADRVLKRVANGAVICLHDGREMQKQPDIRTTISAVERLIPELMARGYALETVSQILCPTS